MIVLMFGLMLVVVVEKQTIEVPVPQSAGV
jgi:hypothetical protein